MQMGKAVVRGLLLLAVLGVSLPYAVAQYRAGIQGVVLDPQGDAVPAATVTLTNLETNKTQQISSDEAGIFNFLSLPPGHYSIDVEKPGFKKKTLDHIEV